MHLPRQGLITLEAKAPNDQGFVLIDNVQVNILANNAYQLPKLSLVIGTNNSLNSEVFFLSQTTFYKSVSTAHYLWDFNEGKLEKVRTIFSNELERYNKAVEVVKKHSLFRKSLVAKLVVSYE